MQQLITMDPIEDEVVVHVSTTVQVAVTAPPVEEGVHLMMAVRSTKVARPGEMITALPVEAAKGVVAEGVAGEVAEGVEAGVAEVAEIMTAKFFWL